MSSTQTDLQLPEGNDAERALLGSLMLEASLWNQANYLSPDDFLIPSHKLVYQAMSEMRDAGLVFNPVLLTDKLKSTGDYDRVGGHSFIASLWDGLPAFSKISDITAYAYTREALPTGARAGTCSHQRCSRCTRQCRARRSWSRAAAPMAANI